MEAIILAAGLGTRLGPLSSKIPKCLVKINDTTLLERQINIMKNCNVTDITVVTGFRGEIIDYPNISYIKNTQFKTTNMNYSLFCAKKKLSNSTLISYSDIVFDKTVIEQMINFNGDFGIGVNLNWRQSYIGRNHHPFSEAENVLIYRNKILKIKKNIITKNPKYKVGEFLGLIKLSSNGAKNLIDKFNQIAKSHSGEFHEAPSFKKAYITDMIQELLDSKINVVPIFINGKWCEIDTSEDLERAKKMFVI